MEAIAAFALACNVVQFVDFGLKTASKCREIYNEGTTVEHQEFSYICQHLTEISENLSASIQNAQTNKPLTKDEHDLQDLAGKCTKSAKDLRDELDKLKVSGRQGKRVAIAKAWKSFRKNDAINRIKDKLCEHERMLDTRLLSRLSQRVDLLAMQQEHSFKDLDQTLQTFVSNLAHGHNKVSDLISKESTTTRSTIAQEHKVTRDYITSNIRHMQIRSVNEQYYAKILRSLYYPEFQQRQETISEAHEKTFRWIFDRTEKVFHPRNNFVGWLERGKGIYWINGKAGSGKSTLMNYITANSRTTDSLQVWANAPQVLTPTFFFWNAGVDLQKSSLGLLQSLLYQILNGHQEVIPELVKSQCIANSDDRTPVWTRRRLESSLGFVIQKIGLPLCFFIDGLDESVEGEEDLLELIRDLQNKPFVKICLSSRPLQCFIDAFEHSAQLKLQDLTRRDIQIYVTDRLHKDPRMEQLLQKNSLRGERLIEDVITKADGVFLWIELAIKILLKGLTNKDDWKTMEKRLNLLPKGIKSLYIHMWSRLGEDQKLYREEAALYFRLVLIEEMSLLEFLIATNEDLQSVLLDLTSDPPGTNNFISMCNEAKVRILTRCAGLLEVDGWDQNMSAEGGPDEDDSHDDHSHENEADVDELDQDPILIHLQDRTKVRFLHRTARDFLVETKEGQVILGEILPPASRPYVMLVKAALGLDRLLPRPSSAVLFNLLNRVRDAQIAENDAFDPLMDIIDSYFGSRYSDVSKKLNWVENYLHHEDIVYRPGTDFLGLAACNGLFLDMSKRFLQHPQRADPCLTNYLLKCALWCSPSTTRVELVLVLLSNGANPLTTFQFHRFDRCQTSSWNQFLSYILFRGVYGSHPGFKFSTIDVCEVVEAFLSNGADIHERVRVSFVRMAYCVFTDQHLVRELNARYILTEFLRHKHRFSRIEKRFESAGVQATQRVVLNHNEAQDMFQPVSEQDSQYLLEAFDECSSLGSENAPANFRTRYKEVSQRYSCAKSNCPYRNDSSAEPDPDGS